MFSGEALLWWLPSVAVVAMTVVALVMAASAPALRARRLWLPAVMLLGAAAIGLTVWRQEAGRAALGAEAARVEALGARLDALARMLPAGPGRTPAETFDTVAAALHALNAKIKDLETQVAVLRQQARHRTIRPRTAADLAADLRRFGPHRVVVSCVPDDVEAFAYANQIANLLRAAGWQAPGPEATAIFGTAPAMGVALYVKSGGTPPETARILEDAFTRFNIPYKPGVTPSDAIPDPATTELFVSHKP
jgi:cell division protein FtsB